MPIYTYACQSDYCVSYEREVDELRPVSEADEPIYCIDCNRAMKRLATNAAVEFVGSGFHVTDYPTRSKSGLPF